MKLPGPFAAALVALALGPAAACVRRVSPAERGAALAADPAFAGSQYNQFACATCHAERPGASGERILPGAPLAGATARPSYWGGVVFDLHEAVTVCYQRFMRGGALDPGSDEAVALWAYMDALGTGGDAVTDAVPFTVVRAVAPPEAGDATRGAALYQRACGYCHGEAHTGAGRLGEGVAIVPEATENEHTAEMGYTPETLRQVFVQKVRHGSFLGFAGVMPPFSPEVLSDRELADIVAYLDPQLR